MTPSRTTTEAIPTRRRSHRRAAAKRGRLAAVRAAADGVCFMAEHGARPQREGAHRLRVL